MESPPHLCVCPFQAPHLQWRATWTPNNLATVRELKIPSEFNADSVSMECTCLTFR